MPTPRGVSYTRYRDTANGAQQATYPGMSVEAMCNIPVAAQWAAKDCVLAMWATLPKLPQAFQVLDAWGFDYHTAAVWAKTSPKRADMAKGIGIWFQGNCELILFATRGKVGGFYEVKFDPAKGKKRPFRLRPPVDGFLHRERGLDAEFWKREKEYARERAALAHDMLLSPKATQHSKKPETLQDYLETFPGPRLELFATRERPNWTCWGFETGVAIGVFGARRIKPEALHKYQGHGRGSTKKTPAV